MNFFLTQCLNPAVLHLLGMYSVILKALCFSDEFQWPSEEKLLNYFSHGYLFEC